ncbi:glycosyltransferase family 2 protein [Microbacterium stercoris]|uniref:Glycosyltransferase n=1 Tax=Microbacterium stercoris TaxID=2820289 RepID=A0A939QL94_9MICO|nr:glycosyltransferase [Microbacterium stercoris]MBO3664984.1 glycosyltransferase [Microbacterium stercoris]
MTPEVDLVIAVHDPARPIDRAVGSVLDATDAEVRVTVVVHGIDPDLIARNLATRLPDPRLRLLPFSDGRRSPAGPFNAGLDAADAPFTSVMGSDDTLEPHAIDSWLRVARRDAADVVIARLRHAGGAAVPTPATRPFRSRRLDGVRDRLSYRSAPLGLVSRARFGDLRFALDVPTGEDIPYVTALWFSGAGIAYDRRGPAYLIHDDGGPRTTFARRSIADEFAWLDRLLAEERFSTLPAAARSAAVAKLIRIQLFGAIFYRADAELWGASERAALADVAARLVETGAGVHEQLSRRDRDVLDGALDPARPATELIAAAYARRRFLAVGSLLPRRLRFALHREAPLRFAAATALQAR